MDTSAAIDLIEKSTHIGILLPEHPTLDQLASAEILWEILSRRNKAPGFVIPLKVSPDKILFPFSGKNTSLPREFVVSLDTELSPIAQMRYEKEEGKINIVFSPKEANIQKEHISYKDGKFLCECAIAIGVSDVDSVGTVEGGPAFLQETPILNIGVSAENKSYGEVNLVAPEKNTVSEIVYYLVSSLTEEPLEERPSTLLLSALLSETDHFRSPSTTADTLLVSSELMRLGASLPKAQKICQDTKDVGLLQLLGRASVRSKLDEKAGILWSFVTAEDFEKTGKNSRELPRIMEHIEKEFPAHKISALVWQNPEDNVIRATISGPRATLEGLEARGSGKFHSPYLQLSATFQNFREAEEILGSLFGNII